MLHISEFKKESAHLFWCGNTAAAAAAAPQIFKLLAECICIYVILQMNSISWRFDMLFILPSILWLLRFFFFFYLLGVRLGRLQQNEGKEKTTEICMRSGGLFFFISLR